MALVELIKRKYPKDSIDIIVFGNEAWPIKIKDFLICKLGHIIPIQLPDWNWQWIFCEEKEIPTSRFL
jgi:hypothetical protein